MEKIDPLAQSRKQSGQSIRSRFERFQPAADGEQRTAQIVKDIQHHALAGFALLGQGAGALVDPFIQLPGKLLGAVKLKGKLAADKDHTAQCEGQIEDAGAADEVEPEGLEKKRLLHGRE